MNQLRLSGARLFDVSIGCAGRFGEVIRTSCPNRHLRGSVVDHPRLGGSLVCADHTMMREVVHLVHGLLIRWNWLNHSLSKLLLDGAWSDIVEESQACASIVGAIPLVTEKVVVGERLMELLPWEWHFVASITKDDATGKLIVERLLFLVDAQGFKFPELLV